MRRPEDDRPWARSPRCPGRPARPTAAGSLGCTTAAINNNGQLVGSCYASSLSHAMLWHNGTVADLGTLGGETAAATAVNNLGQVVGWAQTSTGVTDGFLWSNGTMTDLGPSFSPAAINDNGAIVGGDQVYRGGTLQNLNTLIPAGTPAPTPYGLAPWLRFHSSSLRLLW